MRYRKLTSTGDYSFGQSSANFWIDSPQGVAQSVMTRLLLWQGEWFLDKNEGTPWSQQVIGVRKNPTYDLVIQSKILETNGVSSISSYESVLDRTLRALKVSATIVTVYDPQPVSLEVNL